jgi:hypothetical protein
MAAYADFTYYSTTYLGTAIASTAFNALAVRASALIDLITFDRAAAEVDAGTLDKIKMATCAVAEELQRQDSAGGVDGLDSERQGQYSVKYRKGSVMAQSNQSRVESAAKVYLSSTFLLFPGFNAGEYGGGYEE